MRGGRCGILDAMHVTTDPARRFWRWLGRHAPAGRTGPSGSRNRVPVLVVVLVVSGTAAGVVLAAAGGPPPAAGRPGPATPGTRPAPAGSAAPVVPLLGGNVAAGRAVPVAPVTSAAGAGPAPAGQVAPLRGLRQADLLVVAPFSLSRRVLATVSRQAGVTSADPVEAARVKVNGTYTAVLGVDPSTFRGYAARAAAASDPLWQEVAGGGVAVSYTMGTLDRLSLGGGITVSGLRPERLRVIAFGTVGIGGVDAVVSDSIARSLGMPAGNAIVISAPFAGAIRVYPQLAAQVAAGLA
jgi:peptidoglycan DL-endopeptidase CwlO